MEPQDPQRSACTDGSISPILLLREAVARGDFRVLPRRGFLAMGSAIGASLALAACAPSRVLRLPDAEWTNLESMPKTVVAADPSMPRNAAVSRPVSKPMGEVNPIGEAALPWAKPRFLWAKAPPNIADLNPMLPVTAITVHHDGLDDVLYTTDSRSMTDRLELYRMGHRGKGWADIGYHLVIDRAGTLWQGRSIRWQGAHVKYRNEGNIGVLVMGNFERQQPTAAQLKTLDRALRELMRTYRVPKARVYTHREWPDAETACPGKHLQPKVASLRKRLA